MQMTMYKFASADYARCVKPPTAMEHYTDECVKKNVVLNKITACDQDAKTP